MIRLLGGEKGFWVFLLWWGGVCWGVLEMVFGGGWCLGEGVEGGWCLGEGVEEGWCLGEGVEEGCLGVAREGCLGSPLK